MIACFNDVKNIMQKAYDGLQRGGWIEFQDAAFEISGFNGDVDFESSRFKDWIGLVRAGANVVGRDLTKAKKYKQQLIDAGFTDVCEKVVEVPGGPCGEGDQARMIGVYTANAFHSGVIDTFRNLVVLSGELTGAEVDDLTAQVKEEIREARFQWCTTM